MRAARAVLVLLALALVVAPVAYLLAPRGRPAPAPAPDTAGAGVWRARALAAERAQQVALGEASGWKGKAETALARLRGVEGRPVQIRTVYDTTLQLVHDTVILRVGSDSHGNVIADVALPEDSLHGRRPATAAAVNLSRCDDGWSVTPTGVTCDRAVLGHLEVFLATGARGRARPPPGLPDSLTWTVAAGLRWTPAYRSTAAAEISVDRWRRLELVITKGIRLW